MIGRSRQCAERSAGNTLPMPLPQALCNAKHLDSLAPACENPRPASHRHCTRKISSRLPAKTWGCPKRSRVKNRPMRRRQCFTMSGTIPETAPWMNHRKTHPSLRLPIPSGARLRGHCVRLSGLCPKYFFWVPKECAGLALLAYFGIREVLYLVLAALLYYADQAGVLYLWTRFDGRVRFAAGGNSARIDLCAARRPALWRLSDCPAIRIRKIVLGGRSLGVRCRQLLILIMRGLGVLRIWELSLHGGRGC